MKESLGNNLRNLNELAKNEFVNGDNLENSISELGESVDSILEEMATHQNLNLDTQVGIFEIQKKKQEIMDKLRLDLACLDDVDCAFESGEDVRTTEYDVVTKEYFYLDEKGDKRQATFGEILTDLDWGVEYDFPTSDIPRKDRKRYLLEKAKLELGSLLDAQILLSEINDPDSDDFLRSTYQVIKDRREYSSPEQIQPSFIAEKVVKNFLKQISIDSNLPFEVESTNVYQDVELKMDFIIRRKQESTGVEVEALDDVEDVAIQFTMNEKAREHKERQIERTERKLRKNNEEVKQIALVTFPIADINKLFKQWTREGKVAGGPGKYLDEEVKHKLFFELLKEIYTEEEIGIFWERIGGGV